ncbi:MAG TPA: choice-of-anchor Q domain-containing protein [Solirubrobacterales bacterium]|jgi:hypothetical protein
MEGPTRIRAWLSGLILAALILAALPAAATAAPAVTTTADGGPGSLREAVALAAPGETITIPSGSYKLVLGELTIAKSLTLAGAGAKTTILEGGGASRVIDATNAAAEVTISDLTIRGGHVHTGIAEGGGIFSQAGHLTLLRDTITENTSDATSPGAAGGIADGGGVTVHLETNAALTVRDSTITGNVANASGDTGKPGGIAEGGGLYVRFSGAVEVSGSTISGNQALTRGGGIATGGGVFFSDNSQPGSLSTSTLSGNLAESGSDASGGGGFIITGGPYPFALDRVTATGNSSVSGNGMGEGGGLSLGGSANGAVRMIASTLAGNAANNGGNLGAGSELSIGDTVISTGSGNAGKENCEGAAGITSLGFNLDSLDECDFHAAGDRVNLDPKLGPLADNGGPTATMLPAASSPLVNAGASFGLSADQRGLTRPIEYPGVSNSTAPGADGSDIGAVELQLPPPAKPANPPPPSAAITIKLGKLKKNSKKGTATLTVTFSGPATGTLSLSGKGLKSRSRSVAGVSSAQLVLATTGKARRGLRRNGKQSVRFAVTFVPSSGAAVSAGRGAKLTRRLQRTRAGS